MQNHIDEWLILGITTRGKTFRPSDWAERLCGAFASYSNNRWTYSSYACPVIHEGSISARIKTSLQNIDPAGYRFVMDFARDNQLQMIPIRKIVFLEKPVAAEEVALSVKRLTLALLMHYWKTNFAWKRPTV